MTDETLYPCDFVECPSCRDGKRGAATCCFCNGTAKLLAPLCAVCAETPSQCRCPIPCGKGCAIVHGRQSGPCGAPAVGLIQPEDWSSLLLLFDPIHTLDDAFRCAKHLPGFGDAPFERFDASEESTLGHLRRYIIDETNWKPWGVGRLWQVAPEERRR